MYWIQECYDNLERDYLDEIDAQVRRYTRAATQKIENLTNRDQNIRGNLHTVLTALSRNRRAADLVDTIQPVFRLYEQTCLSESSLWYRKRPGKRTKAAPVLVQETEADTAAAAKAAALLRSEYGRGAIAAYVQGWLGESDVCRSEDIPLENDKDYVMSLLAVLTGGDRSADFTVQELDGERRENGYAIPELQISRKENNE
nr:Wadjet anti-phage system protein JetA family protein [Butyricicoccus sp. AF10-3]